MTPEDAARQTTAHTQPDDPDFDPARGIAWGFLLAACLWGLGLYFLWRCVTGEGL
jgi:hypothetical protein